MNNFITRLINKVLGDYFPDFILWWWFFRRVPNPKDSRPRLLVINHVFDQDLEALARVNTIFNFIIFPATALRFAATQVFPPTVESYLVYNSPALEATRRRWRKIMDRFVSRLKAKYQISAVIAPSDNFFYVRELIPALSEVHLPYYVVDKEGTICPAYFDHFARYIHDQCPLLADHILVWSERQKQFWIKSGVAAGRITITGQPRSDFWRQPERWLKKSQLGLPGLRHDHPLFLFFTYDPWAYTPDYMIDKGEMHWDILRQETHKTLFEFARQHPEIDLLIKAHPQQPDIDVVRAEIAAADCPNIHLATGASLSNDLIINADCVIGFQTTALIEAMVTDKPIIYTFWGEAKEKWANDLVPFHETAGISTVNSPDALAQALQVNLQPAPLLISQRQARDTFVAEYFTTVDGQAAHRTLTAIKNLLE